MIAIVCHIHAPLLCNCYSQRPLKFSRTAALRAYDMLDLRIYACILIHMHTCAFVSVACICLCEHPFTPQEICIT